MKKLILFLGIILNSAFSYSQISIDTDPLNDDIVFLVNNILLSTNLQASNHVFSGDSIQLAYFNAESTNLGFNSGIVLSTGDVSPLEPNFSGVETIVGQDPNITDDDLLEIANSVPHLIGQNFQVNSVNDIASIDFDFIATSDSISFNYVFASQEYFAFENSQYNDVFGFFLSGTGITGPYSSPSSFPDGSINIATFKSQELNSLGQSLPITVSSICNFETNNVVYNPHLFVNNQSFESIAIVDGFTVVMTAKAAVQCGETYHIRLAIADGSDAGVSSFIFLEENSFTSSNMSVSNSLDLDTNYLEIPCGTKTTLKAEVLSGENYTFIWNTGDTTQSISVGEGKYAVQATIDGCITFSDSITVKENSMIVDLGDDKFVCTNDYTNLEVNVQGVPPYSYEWSNGQTTESVSVTNGIHFITVTDYNGCKERDSVIVRELQRPSATLIGEGNICEGQISNFPVIDVQFSGQPPFHFVYTNGTSNFQDTSQLMNYSISAVEEGNYFIRSLEDINCTGTISNTIDITYSSSSSYLEKGQVLCEGDSALLTIHTDVDAPPYDLYLYNGSFSKVYENLTESKVEIYVSDTALYTINKLLDRFSCESQSNLGSAYVRYKEPIFPNFITSIDSVLCPVDEPILLDGIPQGGVFSGKGVDFEGYFHPINAYEGQSYIYYSFPLNCNETDSILVEVDCEVQIYIPNSFTPNNDLVNDFLEVRGNNIIDFEFSIYSRWSEQVFHTTDINSHWNGKYNGRLVPTGTYAYTISAYGKDAKIFKKNGYVNVIH